MAIIYTYPVKTDPVAADKVLISDSEDNNKTKSVSIEDIRSGTVSGVSSILAGNNVTISPAGGTGDVTVNATAYTAGDGIDINSYVVSADVKANSGITIDGTEISLDLSASSISGTLGVADGGTGQTTRQTAINSLTNAAAADVGYVLTSDGTNANYEQINVSNVAGTLAVGNGGTGAQTFSAGFLVASGTSAFTTQPQINLSTDVTNSLGVANGGTGATTLTGVLVGNGTSAITGGGDINDLANAQFSTAANGSLYLGNVPSGLAGSPPANLIAGNGAGNLLTTGSSNILIGNKTGDVLTTGDANTIIGANADSAAAGNDSGVGIGQGVSVGEAGIAIGRAASAGNNELAVGSTSYAITLDATSRSANTFLPIKVNGTQYYIQLYVA